jgi:IS1 family transposase
VSAIAVKLVCALEVEMERCGHLFTIRGISVGFGTVIDHQTGEVLAYTFGTCEYHVLEELLLLLAPFSILRVYVDGNYACEKFLGVDKVWVGKRYT